MRLVGLALAACAPDDPARRESARMDTAPTHESADSEPRDSPRESPPRESAHDTAPPPDPIELRLSEDLGAKLLGEEPASYGTDTKVAGAGDVNADGHADLLVGMPEVLDGGAAYLVLGPVEGTRWLGTADALLLGASSERAGASVAGVGDVDGDGYDDVLVGAPNHDGTGEYEGQAYLLRGPMEGVALADAWATLHGAAVTDRYCESFSETGSSVAGAGDANGDGLADVLVGAYANECGAGAAYLLYGDVSGTIELAEEADVIIAGVGDWGCCLGETVASAGDANGDGLDDVLVEWMHYVDFAQVLLFFSPIPERIGGDDADARLVAGTTNERVGTLVGLGDTDGDGYPEVGTANATDQEGAYYGGAALVFRGPLGGSRDLDSYDAKLVSERSQDYAGRIAGADDVDADGRADMLVGAWGDAGTTYLALGPVAGLVSLEESYAILEGEGGDDAAGGVAGPTASTTCSSAGRETTRAGTTRERRGSCWRHRSGRPDAAEPQPKAPGSRLRAILAQDPGGWCLKPPPGRPIRRT